MVGRFWLSPPLSEERGEALVVFCLRAFSLDSGSPVSYPLYK
jgi:hypothetical protein